MSLPSQSKIEIPLLKALVALGGEAETSRVYEEVDKFFPHLTREEKEERLSSRPSVYKWRNRIQWTRQRLVDRAALDAPKRGVWRITDEGRAFLARLEQGIKESPPLLSLAALFSEILARYPEEYKNGGTLSNPYMSGLRNRIQQTFEPLCKHYGLDMRPMGGQGALRKESQYMTFLAPGHKTSKGIYPSVFFDFSGNRFHFKLGVSDDNPPPESLIEEINNVVWPRLKDFPDRSQYGFPCKWYQPRNLDDTVLNNDLRHLIETYLDMLDTLAEPIEEFLETGNTDGAEGAISADHLKQVIASFLEWYERSGEKREVGTKVYPFLSEARLRSISASEFVEKIFALAREGGKIQSGGERTAGQFRNAIEDDIESFRAHLLDIYRPEFDLKKWWDDSEEFNGFGKGLRSIVLSHMQPDQFTVFNNKSFSAYQRLGLIPNPLPVGSFHYGLVLDAAREIVALDPKRLNLALADYLTHYLAGTVEGQAAFERITGNEWSENEQASDKSLTQYWLLAAGRDGAHEKEFFRDGVIAIGWDDLGDLSEYSSKAEIQRKLQELSNGETSQKNNALACYEFAREIRIGDYVFLKQGTDQILGFGRVESAYQFDPLRSRYRHIRRVKWIGVERNVIDDIHLAQKTLTNVTDDTDLLSVLLPLYEDSAVRLAPSSASKLVPYSTVDALADLFVNDEDLEGMLSALRYKKNIILQGPPGVGKTFMSKRLAYCLMGEKAPTRVQMVQFHQSYSYEDFIQGYRPNRNGGFERKDGIFLKFCQLARKNPEQAFVFIIDEINRGNLSKIFGELMVLLEADKRGEENRIPLTYSDDSSEAFFIPENVYLIGTMNTADRSLAMVDYALRRRFQFFDLKPALETPKFREHLSDCGVSAQLLDRIVTRITALNHIIADDKKDLGPGYEIGHSFFVPPTAGGPTLDDFWYRQVITLEIAPLIREYWFDKTDKAEKAIERLLE